MVPDEVHVHLAGGRLLDGAFPTFASSFRMRWATSTYPPIPSAGQNSAAGDVIAQRREALSMDALTARK